MSIMGKNKSLETEEIWPINKKEETIIEVDDDDNEYDPNNILGVLQKKTNNFDESNMQNY